MSQKTQNIGVTLSQATRSCGCNSPDRKTLRSDKLKFRVNNPNQIQLSRKYTNLIAAPPLLTIARQILDILPNLKGKCNNENRT